MTFALALNIDSGIVNINENTYIWLIEVVNRTDKNMNYFYKIVTKKPIFHLVKMTWLYTQRCGKNQVSAR